MLKWIVAAGAAVFVTGCSEDAAAPKQEATPTTLAAGQYEASWKVTNLRSVDKTTPATNLKQDGSGTTLACVAADGTIDPKLFSEDGDDCASKDPYFRNGRIGLNLTCHRKGTAGEVRQSVTGSFKAETLEADVSTTTYLDGPGDYAMTRSFTAKRVGDCPPAVAATEEKKG